MNINLVYVHIGKILPESFLDNIYQTLLTNDNIKIKPNFTDRSFSDF